MIVFILNKSTYFLIESTSTILISQKLLQFLICLSFTNKISIALTQTTYCLLIPEYINKTAFFVFNNIELCTLVLGVNARSSAKIGFVDAVSLESAQQPAAVLRDQILI